MGLFDWIGRSVDELMDLGYPESVAKRISSGELPMDLASRMKRAAEQGYDIQRPEVTGKSSLLTELDKPLWSSRSPDLAATYAKTSGSQGGNSVPLLVKREGREIVDADGRRWNDLLGDGSLSTDDVIAEAQTRGVPSVMFGQVRDVGPHTYRKPHDVLKGAFRPQNNTVTLDPTAAKSFISAAFDPEYTGSNILGSRIAPTAGAGLLGAMALSPEDAMAMESGMPAAMQAGGQSAMDAKPDLGRDTGTILGLLDFLLPLVGEAFKPATMGDAELTEEQRRQRKYYGQ